MAVKLHRPGYDHAKQLIAERKVVAIGTPDELRGNPDTAVQQFLTAMNTDQIVAEAAAANAALRKRADWW